MILVELAGVSGAGKSTLSPLVARRLREHLGEGRVAALPEKDVPRRLRRWTRLKRWLWMALHPWHALTAARACRCHQRASCFSAWMRIFSTMGLGRSALASGVDVVLVDQGILRLPILPVHVPLLPRPLLPDLVLQIVADPATLELRRLRRDKKVHRRLQGEARFQRAREIRRVTAGLPASEQQEALALFSAKFCSPALSEAELAAVLTAPLPPPADSPASPASRCEPGACALLKQHGIGWRQIDTSAAGCMPQAVEDCLAVILDALGQPAIQPSPATFQPSR